MMDFAKSMVSASFALPFRGLRQMAGMLEGGKAPRDPGGLLGGGISVFQEVLPKQMAFAGFGVAGQCAQWFGGMAPGRSNQLAWREFRNKIQAFSLFQYVDLILDLPRNRDLSLSDQVAKARKLGPFFSVWAWEGLGYHHAKTCWARKGEPDHLLVGDETLPAESLIPLHVGLGMASARHLLESRSKWSAHEVPDLSARFLSLCRSNSRPGYSMCAFEALGMVTCLLYPRLMPEFDKALRAMDPAYPDYFWHGVGRAAYFAPENAIPLPDSGRCALELCLRHAPHDDARNNSLAGLAWALTLVNLGEPKILDHLLLPHCPHFEVPVSQGIRSAILVWHDCSARDPLLAAFLRYRSPGKDSARWTRMVAEPCTRALEYDYPKLKRDNRLEEVFHFGPSAVAIE